MEQNIYVEDFLTFCDKCSGSAFQAAKHLSTIYDKNGFVQLKETQLWNLERNKKYYFKRDDQTLFAFAVGGKYEPGKGVIIAGGHIDSPSLKLKPKPFQQKEEFNLVSCETYGGGVWTSWFDRDLGISGRIIIQRKNEQKEFESYVLTIKEGLYRISTCAPHLDKRYAKGMVIDKEKELPAIGLSKDELFDLIVEHYNKEHEEKKITKEDIFDFDLYLCDSQKPNLLGAENEFVVGQGLDDMTCSYGCVFGLIEFTQQLENSENILMSCTFDVEEIGSRNRRGADSVIIPDVIKRILSCFVEKNFVQTYQITIANSIVLSCDVGHASHPNFGAGEKNHIIKMNSGIYYETSANQNIVGDRNILTIVKSICSKFDIPVQINVKKQEGGGGGSTIGPKIASYSGINVIDIGVALLSMHSIREIGGIKDIEYLKNMVVHVMELYSQYEDFY